MAQKILILSLGTGRRNQTPGAEHDCPYKTVKYVFEDGEDVTESPFVAEALIKRLQPEKIIIVGTGKSAWGAFYYQYCNRMLPDCEARLQEIEECIAKMNMNSDEKELGEFQQYLDEIYRSELDIPGKPEIKLCLTRYGMDEAELKSIYIKLRDCLKETITESAEGADAAIEISFDITHSFRSIPLYNLTVIDYCRLLSRSKITISHVYYGNVEVVGEAGAAKIVDLKDIVNLMETTRGINEFKNTGNATSFLQWQEKSGVEDDEFLNLLRNFNEAVQLNNRTMLMKAMEELLSVPLQGDENVLMDAKATIHEAMRREFQISDDKEKSAVSRQRYKAQFQIVLAKWCLKNGQVGLAAAIAKEALRSFLVTVYETPENEYEDENRRKNAENNFRNKRLQDKEDPLFDAYNKKEEAAAKVRNIFAHNLESDEKSDSYKGSRGVIDQYINTIEQIMLLENGEFTIEKERALRHARGQKVIVFISADKKERRSYSEYVAKKNSRAEILCLDGDFNVVRKDNKTDNKMIRTKAKVITYKLSELYAVCGKNGISKVVFGSDIDERLIQHTAVLTRAYIMENNLPFAKWNESKVNPENQVVLQCTWPVDAQSILDDPKENNWQTLMSNYAFK